jgi:hypothetical protein
MDPPCRTQNIRAAVSFGFVRNSFSMYQYPVGREGDSTDGKVRDTTGLRGPL